MINDPHSTPAEPHRNAPAGIRVRVIGIGGAGSNAVDRMVADERVPLDAFVINTDAQALNAAKCANKVLVGRTLTRGLSTGGDPEVGHRVAQKDRELLASLVEGQDLIFIVAGLGGGTGSALASALAQLAIAHGALVIGFVTLPFEMEGQKRHQIAQVALGQLRGSCDALLTLPNDLLMQHMEPESTVLDAFAHADAWMVRAIQSVSTMVLRTGIINLDLAALRSAFESGGRTLFGLGRGQGRECVEEALNDLLICPLLNLPEHRRRADRLLLNIIGGRDLSLAAINRILSVVTEHFGSREHTVIGAVIDERLEQSIQLCVIGTTSLENNGMRRRPVAVPGRLPADVLTPLRTGGAAAAADAGAAARSSVAANSQPPAGLAGVGSFDASGDGDETEADSNFAALSDGSVQANGEAGAAAAELLEQSFIHGTEPVASAAGSAAGGNLFARDEEFPADLSAAVGQPPRVHESKLKQRKKQQEQQRADTDQQEEFHFVGDGEQRGMFEKTDRNLYDGEDLDVPTYLRRNLRIVLQ